MISKNCLYDVIDNNYNNSCCVLIVMFIPNFILIDTFVKTFENEP